MTQRGRRSASSLSIVSASESVRSKPPEYLSEPEKATWRAITAAFKPTWFQGCEAILVLYCRTITTERQLAAALAECGVHDERYPELLRLYIATAGSMISIATKLRLTPQSSRDSRHSKLAPITSGRPWEDEDSELPEPPVQKN